MPQKRQAMSGFRPEWLRSGHAPAKRIGLLSPCWRNCIKPQGTPQSCDCSWAGGRRGSPEASKGAVAWPISVVSWAAAASNAPCCERRSPPLKLVAGVAGGVSTMDDGCADRTASERRSEARYCSAFLEAGACAQRCWCVADVPMSCDASPPAPDGWGAALRSEWGDRIPSVRQAR